MTEKKEKYRDDPYKDLYKESFGEALGGYRKAKDLSIRKLAVKTGLSASYLSYLERGIHGPPSIEVTKKLALALDVNPDILLAEAGLIDPEVTDAIRKNPEQLTAAIRKSNKDSTEFLIDLIGVALISVFVLGKQFDSDGKEKTAEEIYKAVQDLIEKNGNTFIEEKDAHRKIATVMKLWKKDLKERESNEKD